MPTTIEVIVDQKRPAEVSEKLVWDDFQKGKECQEIVAKFTLNEVVLDYIHFIKTSLNLCQ